MTRPIILWQSESTLSTDDAGVTILKSTSPPSAYFQPGPYSDEDNPRIAKTLVGTRVPPLSYFCIKCLVQAPELIYHYGTPRPYRPPEFPSDPDILQFLIPRSTKGHFNLGKVDPRLWAILVQIYSDLPHSLQTYRTALSDKYIPLLQRVPTTEHFSLLTVLELPGCSHLNDDTIVHLTALHTLCALDASRSAISALGVRRLSGTVKSVDDGVDCANRRRGPWQLRILSLHHCKRVTNAIYQHLEPFILLAAVDLRGTSCTWDREKIPPSFYPAVEKRLYYPTTPLEALSLLLDSQGLIPSSDFGVLHIDHLTHASRKRSRKSCYSLDIGSSTVAADSNMALLTCHMANYPPNLDDSPCSPERAPSLQRLPHLHLSDELPQKSSMESGETTLHTMHDVVAEESDAYEAQYKAKMFYSQRAVGTSSSMTTNNMPQWGQELLMLYREPPPWSRAQLPPIVKTTSRPRSVENLAPVNRTNEQTMKNVQEMRDILSERHRLVKETDGSCDSKKALTKPFVSRNPFAVRFGKSSAPVQERANEERTTPQHADTVTKSTVVTPKSSQFLRPISSLPVPIPTESFIPIPENRRLDSGQAACGPARRRDSSRNRRSISLQNNEYRDQRVGRRSGADRAEPAAARKRTRTAASDSGSKAETGFDWSSWAHR